MTFSPKSCAKKRISISGNNSDFPSSSGTSNYKLAGWVGG